MLQDKEALSRFCQESLDQELSSQELAVSGRNWGAVGLNGSSLMYKVDDKVMFEVPLPDVSQAQQTKVGQCRTQPKQQPVDTVVDRPGTKQ